MENQIKSKISIIIADDHPVFRSGLETTLKNVNMIGSITHASNGDEVLRLLESKKFDLVFMDIKMPGMDGIQVTGIITQKHPSVKVIALSMLDDHENISAIIKKGAKGYLLKNADREIILEALTNVMSGRNYYSTEVSSLLLDKLFKDDNDSSNKDLSINNPLVREIIFLLCHELTNLEIGNLIYKSPRTIEFYRNKLLKLTGSKNIVGIVKYAIEHKILDDVALKAKWKKLEGKK